jgi:hypothetical protein
LGGSGPASTPASPERESIGINALRHRKHLPEPSHRAYAPADKVQEENRRYYNGIYARKPQPGAA